MRTTRPTGLFLTAAAACFALAGCAGGGEGGPAATVTRTVTPSASAASEGATPVTPATSPPATPTCGPSDGATAAAGPIADLPLPAGLESARWDATTADTSLYDGCAALSAVTVSVAEGTASSPVAILLFHDGTYVGTATEEQYPFVPEVTRTSADAIRVEYRYPQGTEGNADPSGRATATYTWDDTSERVGMSGDVPPSR
ncbi:LppP/LprE family lipoprotein [Curtobacterium sp. MCSS17_007]|uniref:LppP/LprE family lipoprotein n=1 Tax=Curtobacterium sp. MCSS17_007 TaxID=2175646 RepID=UPI000DA72D10|nr:LppP/LprE family lipoprotein [Curtobacterium sp. MCSS17_007]WIE75153.1 LppP/LprE family lipoprotein [Curtobacterium sp. MCSS17_007]